jgi:nucleoside-triphosphatase THEP1
MEDLKTEGNKKWGMTRTRVRDEESRTGYKIDLIDNTRGEYDWEALDNKGEKRKVQSMVGRYKKQAINHLESVSRGEF